MGGKKKNTSTRHGDDDGNGTGAANSNVACTTSDTSGKKKKSAGAGGGGGGGGFTVNDPLAKLLDPMYLNGSHNYHYDADYANDDDAGDASPTMPTNTSSSASPLAAVDVVPDQPHFILVIDDFLSDVECERLIRAADSDTLVQLKPPNPADLKPKKNEALLNRDSAAVVSEGMSEILWRRLLPLLPVLEGKRQPLGFVGDGRMGDATPNQFKFYRYQKGHSFGLHVDVSRKGPRPGDETEYTFLMYLNSAGEPVPISSNEHGQSHPLVGGDTVFMATAKKELCRVTPKAGTAMLHAHGRRCLLHEGEEVRKGIKYVLRADIMYGWRD